MNNRRGKEDRLLFGGQVSRQNNGSTSRRGLISDFPQPSKHAAFSILTFSLIRSNARLSLIVRSHTINPLTFIFQIYTYIRVYVYIYIYVFLIATNRHGIFDFDFSGRETFRFRFEGYSIIDGNVHECLTQLQIIPRTISDIYLYMIQRRRRGSFGRVFYRAL